MTDNAQPVPGQFTLVLHSHLPWLAHHGRWPVGEEWLYQSWAASYLPVVEVLRTLAAEGRSHLLTLGITPVLAAQLDDPHCLAGMHHWLGNWQLRADEAAMAGNIALGRHEHRLAAAAPPLSTPRRDMAETMSPKYSPADLLGTSWKHALPHL